MRPDSEYRFERFERIVIQALCQAHLPEFDVGGFVIGIMLEKIAKQVARPSEVVRIDQGLYLCERVFNSRGDLLRADRTCGEKQADNEDELTVHGCDQRFRARTYQRSVLRNRDALPALKDIQRWSPRRLRPGHVVPPGDVDRDWPYPAAGR